MTRSSQNFVLAITGHNVGPFLTPLVSSLATQRCTAWHAIFVDDCSTDGTLESLCTLLAAHALMEKVQIVANEERRYRAQNLFHAIRSHAGPEDVVAILDGDDHLADNDALGRIALEYGQGWEVVWSNWRGSDGSRGTSSHLNPFVSPRRQAFVSSHLFTFKRKLFDLVAEADLQDDDGRWFEAGSDVAIAWPILEQTIKRKHIEDVLYVYNRANPQSHDRRNPGRRPYVSTLQARTSSILRRRPGREPTVDQAFLQAHLYEFLQAAMQSAQLATRHEVARAMVNRDKR